MDPLAWALLQGVESGAQQIEHVAKDQAQPVHQGQMGRETVQLYKGKSNLP